MLRLVKSVEERPEHSTVINWTVPVYIKNGEDYYKAILWLADRFELTSNN